MGGARDERVGLAGVKFDRGVVERANCPEALAHVLEDEHRHLAVRGFPFLL